MKKLSGKITAACLVLVLAAVAATRTQAQTFTVLHNFAGPPSDGAFSAASLVMDAAGNLYGTTAFGGSGTCIALGMRGCGIVFKLDPSGHETVLHQFSGGDGAIPAAGLLMDAAGNLYGTTVQGGGAGFCGNFGCGTVFKLDPSGHETVLHGFTGGSDGGNPTAGLIMDSAGNLYGTAGFGGNFGAGVVFRIDALGNERVLHSFTGGDGREPSAALIMDAAGNLYTTAFRGGGTDFGTVVKFDSFGNSTVLHSFTGGSDGGNRELEGIPAAGLIMDAGGNLYGTNSAGGGSSFAGTVFKLDTLDNETVLHSFTGAEGAIPFAGLIMDTAGNLYGTASGGGASGGGTVFKLTVQTPQQVTQAVVNSVNALFSQGVLNGGQDNSLVAQLQHAITMMDAGKNAGAIGNLESFISEVNDLLSSGVLSPAQAAPLINAAQSVIARLS